MRLANVCLIEDLSWRLMSIEYFSNLAFFYSLRSKGHQFAEYVANNHDRVKLFNKD